MVDDTLAEPVQKLLALGEPKYARETSWPDYRSFGIETEHIPSLIAIAVDHTLLCLEDESDSRVWGPIHAWRALGQLKACQAIRPLIQLFHQVQDNDWIIEEMPDVFALIGPEAFADLAAYLRDSSYPSYARLVAATSLMQMALVHPHLRSQAIDLLAVQLSGFQQNSPGMNGVLIANLVELEAAEKADLIQKVFSEGKVDRFIGGDWRDIRLRLNPQAHQREQRKTRQLEKDVDSIPPDPEQRASNQEPCSQSSSRPDTPC